jgi:uncharacterized protein (TIGR02145 family)
MKNVIKIMSCLAMLAMQLACKKEQAELTVTDIDGNVYKTVKIGDQIWMAENLKTHKLNDGTPIAYVTSDVTWADINITSPMVCYHDNDVTNKDKSGALYNWHAVNSGKLAPKGWHVPTDADWQKLTDYLIANGYNYDGTTTGNKIGKSLASISGWSVDDKVGSVGNAQAGNNKSGFNGSPGGCRYIDGTFSLLVPEGAYWWSSDFGQDGSFFHSLQYFTENLNYDYASPNAGLSVRCVKD